MEILFAQLIVGPAATEQRQIDVALSLSNVERQTGKQQLPTFNVFWYDAARDRTHDLPIMRRTLYWLSQHIGVYQEGESLKKRCLTVKINHIKL